MFNRSFLPILFLSFCAALCLIDFGWGENRVWNSEDIFNEDPNRSTAPRKPKYCNGGAFKPCVCASDVTRDVRYFPSLQECSRRAAVVVSRKYLSLFSVVVRDFLNRDRWPPEGINGCTPFERDVLALNKCSAFKTQRRINLTHPITGFKYKVFCLGASGYSQLFAKVRRITIKLRDVATSNNDPIVRLCLHSPKKSLNNP
ncbi:MAG TPA: hypothetical protein PKD37_03740 [Oligoflexia bacterium]|nr:hypothetical protein [Oligoflexia bacterium]HMP27079.1 hypothetical protein [Oligoflexia bacterium]